MAVGEPTSSRGTGRLVRLGIALQVGAMIAVAAGCAYLVTWLSARPGLQFQFDWTAGRSNTLPPELAEIVERIPEHAKIETFLRPLDAPYTELSADVIARLKDFLFVLSKSRGDKLDVLHWNLDDLAGAKARLAELDLREDNVIVVSSGNDKTLLRLWRDIAQIEPGNPDPRQPSAPRLANFRPEEALALALKRVSTGAAVRVLFTAGHGEREIVAPGEASLAEFTRSLARDGFAVGTWDSTRADDVPADCAVLVVADPRQAFAAEELAALRRYLDRGGRLFVVPTSSDAALANTSAFDGLLAECGIQVAVGRIAVPFRDPSGVERVGDARCATLAISADGMDPRHPVTESLWRSKRRLIVPFARGLSKSKLAPTDATFAELLRASRDAWIDRPTANATYAWLPDPESEVFGPITACVAMSRPAPAPVQNGEDERAVTRVVVLGSAECLTDGLFAQNGDFALNAINWLAARDWRLSISPRANERLRIDVRESSALPWFNRIAVVGLPLVCAVLGLVLFLRRRS
ncbi:MAG: Gldg family protein [Planctomycetes bacterium]|nr:Gldg family protein [Planctomycetota bacterium]